VNQTSNLEFEELLVVAEEAGRSLITYAEKDLDANVPNCPGWNNLELLNHMKGVWWFVAAQIVAGNDSERAIPSDEPLDSPLSQLTHLIDAFKSSDFSSPAWSWTSDKTVGFFIRRMAHENTVHDWDAKNALGIDGQIPTLLALDGIEEKLFLVSESGATFPNASIHLHCTDCEGEWMLALSSGELEIKREHGKGDAAVKGRAEDILLYLWGRGQENLECFGDEEVINTWARIGP
jgi:uncharacterized protein (TIGR03083 family)